MRSIFNEKVSKKCNLWVREQYMKVLFTEDLVNNCGLKKRKKKKERKTQKEKTWTHKCEIQTCTKKQITPILVRFLIIFMLNTTIFTIYLGYVW